MCVLFRSAHADFLNVKLYSMRSTFSGSQRSTFVAALFRTGAPENILAFLKTAHFAAERSRRENLNDKT